jgi:hypothetical protein
VPARVAKGENVESRVAEHVNGVGIAGDADCAFDVKVGKTIGEVENVNRAIA